MADHEQAVKGMLPSIVNKFLTSHLSIILILLSACLGIAAIIFTPREEEPQIVVPLADIYVHAPGASAQEVEKLAATPLEKLLWQIDGVEYVYSTARNDMAIVTVRFYVGEDREASLVKLHNKISMNIDQVPSIVKGWVIKPVEIDDVPIVNLTLYSAIYDDHALRRMGEEILSRLALVENISRTEIIGGRKREIRVELDPEKMNGLSVSLLEVQNALTGADASITAGTFDRFNQTVSVVSHAFLSHADQVAALVVGVNQNRPVYLRDIASVYDGPEEAATYTRIAYADHQPSNPQFQPKDNMYPAVTLSLAKKKGTNAVTVAQDILEKLDEIKATLLPDDVFIEVTRNYGNTAQEKVNGLLSSLGFAIVSVVILLALTLGWREALVVALAVPISFSLALFVNFIFGYTINRVTLFALILSLGLVVDDPITNVDNIQRHILKGKRTPLDATLFAVNEVLPPVIMSTIAIIICFTPLFFITGMMGPYMGPMAANVPLTVIFSTVCALTIVPWFSHLLLKGISPQKGREKQAPPHPQKTGGMLRLYGQLISPFLSSRLNRYLLLFVILMLFGFSGALALFRWVPLKLLPFDNKSEFQILIDMDEGTPLEMTDAAVRDFERFLKQIPEITNMTSYVGTASPIDFNGLVRHYYLRQGGHLADIRVHLMEKDQRDLQSHAIVLRLRKELEAIAQSHNAIIQVVEVPPGPPVLSTIVAEVYGSPDKTYQELIDGAHQIKTLLQNEPDIVDVDVMTESTHERLNFVIDKEKAALHGVTSDMITQSLRIALKGTTPAIVHTPNERQPLQIHTILPRAKRSGAIALSQIPIKAADGNMIPLAELADIIHENESPSIYHKNLDRVVYVIAETAGGAPAEAVLDMQSRLKASPLAKGLQVKWSGEGEWKITIRVFRDMGIAFAAALMGIYILLILQSGSFFMPILIMMAIPLTLLGIMPGFWLLNILFTHPIGGYNDPIFFTATSMIGMIALGGIVIRNSLVLIEFIQEALKQGTPLKEAILQSGAIRMRPILLTAATTALGAWPITLDPVFSGLAWALIFGLFASTGFTLVVIPVTYYAIFKDKQT